MVRITQLDDAGESCTWGSGAIVDPTGLILTNFHVAEVNPECPYEHLGIELSDDPERPPELQYFASVVAYEEVLDLAVLRITSSVGGGPLPSDLPTVAVGDSDAVAIGAPLTVLGFPSLGGETVTVTTGTVSGFRADGEHARGWFKTDATVTGGNSGGEALNPMGELVAVPTEASKGVFGEVADCRPSRDTNQDGEVDGNDQCVPIGGFLTLLRPVALGRELLAKAATAGPVPIQELWPEGYGPDENDPGMVEPVTRAPRFGTGVVDGELQGEGSWLPTGADQVCLFLDFEGMTNGDEWGYAWYHDGSKVASETREALVWRDGEQATQALCAGVANNAGVKDGLWEVRISLSSISGYRVAYSVLVGDDHATAVVTVGIARANVCALDTRPIHASEWQTSARSDSWTNGDSFSMELPSGRYDLRAIDCDGGTLGYGLDVDIKDGVSLRVT